MPCRPDEESMQLHAVADPATPKATPSVDREADASSDDEGLETEDEEVTAPKKSKRGIALLRGNASYFVDYAR